MPSTPITSKTSSVSFSLLLVFIFLSPIPLGSNREWAEALLLLISSFLAATSLFLIFKQQIYIPSLITKSLYFQMAFAGIIAWQVVQLIILPIIDINHQLTGLQLSFCYWITFNLILLHVHSHKRLKILLWAIVCSGLFQAFYGSMMVLTGIEWLVWEPKTTGSGVATGTFVNRNHLAGYLEITLACGLGLLIAQLKDHHFENNKARLQHLLETLLSPKIVLRLILCIMVIALVMTRSRMGNIAFFTSMLLCGGMHLFLIKKFSRSALILFASLLIIDTFIVSQWFGLEELAARLNITMTSVEIKEVASTRNIDVIDEKKHYKLITGDGRDQAWEQAKKLAKSHYLTGTGYGSFYTLFPQYRDGTSMGFYDFVHNDYLQFIIEFGLIGSFFLAMLAFMALQNSIATQRHSKNKAAISGAFACMMGISAIAIHSWTDFNLYIPANAMLICILLALSIIARWQTHTNT